jgi:hypothetical protein
MRLKLRTLRESILLITSMGSSCIPKGLDFVGVMVLFTMSETSRQDKMFQMPYAYSCSHIFTIESKWTVIA